MLSVVAAESADGFSLSSTHPTKMPVALRRVARHRADVALALDHFGGEA